MQHLISTCNTASTSRRIYSRYRSGTVTPCKPSSRLFLPLWINVMQWFPNPNTDSLPTSTAASPLARFEVIHYSSLPSRYFRPAPIISLQAAALVKIPPPDFLAHSAHTGRRQPTRWNRTTLLCPVFIPQTPEERLGLWQCPLPSTRKHFLFPLSLAHCAQ